MKHSQKIILGILIMFILLSIMLLSGCNELLPSDEKCRQAISAYLLVHSNFYDTNDVIYLKSWEGNKRVFEWCHYGGSGIGTYCDNGYIDSSLNVFYSGD